MTLHLDLRRAARVGVALSVAALGLVLVATPAWAAVPDAPTITSVTRGNAQISVAFTPGGNGGFPVLTFGATCTSSDGGVTGSTTGVASPLAVTGLTNGKTYTCTVIATNVIGNSAPSAPSDAIVPATVPSAPTITSATAGDATITVAFTPGSDGGSAITSFSASCTSLDGGAAGSQTGSGSPIAVTILTNAKTYTCTVTATNAVGTSAASLPSTPAVPGAAPDAPTITIVVPDDAQIAVGFTPGNDHGFPVITFTATCTSSNGGASGSTTGVASPLTVTGLTNGKTYTCTVTATNVRGTSGPSAPSSAVVPKTFPAAPTITSATSGDHQIQVAFTPGSDGGSPVTSFDAACSSLDGGAAGTTSGSASPLTVTSLTNGKTYTCTVTASNAVGASAPSNPSAPAIPGTVPAPPTITIVVPDDAQIGVGFTAGDDHGFAVLSFQATCASGDGGTTGSATGVASPITVTGLTNGKTYTCTVTATNVKGTSAASSPSDPVVPRTVPSAPTITGTTPGDAQIEVAFTAGFDGGSPVTSFDAACASLDGGTAGTGSAAASPVTVTGLSNGKAYTCTVTANNAAGSSPASSPSLVVLPGTVPGAPAITGVTPGTSEVSVAFTPGPDNGYPVLTFQATCTSSNGGTAGSATGTSSPVVVTALTNGKTYTCTVTATNALGTSAPSAPSDAVVPADLPQAPTVTSVTRGDARVTVAFTPGADGGSAVTSFASTCTSSNGGVSGTQSDAASPITVTGLTNGKTYTCTVTATSPRGTSAASAPSAAVTPAAPPSPPTISSATRGNQQITVAFLAGADNGSAVTSFGVTCTSSSGGVSGTKSASASPITVTALTNGKTYTCTVTATNALGTSAPSSPSAAVVPATLPGVPTISGVSRGGSGEVKVSISSNGDGGSPITSYTATCTSTDGGVTGTRSSAASPVTVIGLTNRKTYTCKATATNAVGTSASSAASASIVTEAPLVGIAQISAGDTHTCARLTDGTAKCWGSNASGQLGDGTTVSQVRPVTVKNQAGTGTLTGVAQISTGVSHTCVVLTDGTARCWGSNANGQLGDGTTVNRLLPVPVSNGAGGSLSSITSVAAAGTFSCARMNNTTARCWGSNASGQLGDNTTVNRLTSVPVRNEGDTGSLTAIKSVAVRGSHTCARMSEATVRCWGSNSNGELGDGTTIMRLRPVAVKNTAGVATLGSVADIDVGTLHSCARLTDSTMRCWGGNSSGQLGDGTTTMRLWPVAVKATTGTLGSVAQMSVRGTHSCATLTDGTARCWGNNANGRLGDGTTTNRLLPVIVKDPTGSANLTGVIQVSAGMHSCAVMTDGSARCWGGNANGQLGDGTTTGRLLPVQVILP